MKSVAVQWVLALICLVYTIHVRWRELREEPLSFAQFWLFYSQNPGALQTLVVFCIFTCAMCVEFVVRFMFTTRIWKELKVPYAYLLIRCYLIFRLDVNGLVGLEDTTFLLIETLCATALAVVGRAAHSHITSTYRIITDAMSAQADALPELPPPHREEVLAGLQVSRDGEQPPSLNSLVNLYLPNGHPVAEPNRNLYDSRRFILFPLLMLFSFVCFIYFACHLETRFAMLSLDFIALFVSQFSWLHDFYFMKQTIIRCSRSALRYASASAAAATRIPITNDVRLHFSLLRNGFRVNLASWNVHASKAQANSTRIQLYNEAFECVVALLQMYLYIYSYGMRPGSVMDILLPIPIVVAFARAWWTRSHANRLASVASAITSFEDAGPDHPKIRSGDVCSICLDVMESAKILPCGHLLHEHCLLELHRFRGGRCPVCRQPFDQSARAARVDVQAQVQVEAPARE